MIDALLKRLAPQVLGVMARRTRDFAASEDAVQEALIAAAARWPVDGVPANPRGWLVAVAARRLTDHVRSELARRRREEVVVSLAPPEVQLLASADEQDDTLELLFTCCHPALSEASAIALTLRAVGGLTTAEIARGFLVPEATMAQRIARAKATITASGVPFAVPEASEREARLRAVLHVLYLIFNEGYASSGGPDVLRVELAAEAIRLARAVHALLPDDAEVTGLLALMLLTDARRPARTGPHGELVPLAEQDRARWDPAAIAEGIALVSAALPRGAVGAYQLQAAIAAVHDEAATADATDWPQILALYGVLATLAPSPMVELARAIATAMVDGPAAGLGLLDALATEPRLASGHRLPAARAHLLERAGDHAAAREHYLLAAGRTANTAERDYLLLRAAALPGPGVAR